MTREEFERLVDAMWGAIASDSSAGHPQIAAVLAAFDSQARELEEARAQEEIRGNVINELNEERGTLSIRLQEARRERDQARAAAEATAIARLAAEARAARTEEALREFMAVIRFDDGAHAGEVGVSSWQALASAAHKAYDTLRAAETGREEK